MATQRKFRTGAEFKHSRNDGRRERHDQNVVDIAECGAQAERAADHDATISLFHHLGGEPLRRWSEAVRLRPHDGRGRQ